MTLRARLLSWVIRRRVRPRMLGTIDVAAMRDFLDRLAAPPPRGASFSRERRGGIVGERVTTLAREPRPLRMFYIHGGGFVSGSPRSHRSITGAFARRGFDVFAVDYRLAPEHPFPAALDDVVAAWSDFAEEGPAVVAGDSAGANLALALVVRAGVEGLASAQAVALMSPPVDLLGEGESFRTNAPRDPMFEIDGLRQLVALYLADADPSQPCASPLNADLSGFPPLCIHVGESEVLRDDARRLAEKATRAGVPVALHIVPHVPHVWQWAERFLPEARQSLDEAADFLRRYSGSGQSD